MRELGFRERI